MREIAEQSLGWLVLLGGVLAFVLARKRYKGKYSSDIAQARAEGYAAAKVELGVSQSVTVTAGNVGREDAHACSDPWSCLVCAPVLFRVLSGDRRGAAAAIGGAGGQHDYHDEYDHYDRTGDNGRVDVWRRRQLGGVVGDDGRRVTGAGRVGGDGPDFGGVEVVPCASLSKSGSAFTARPELVADMARRPWAYDEADPRFEGSRGGRGPAR